MWLPRSSSLSFENCINKIKVMSAMVRWLKRFERASGTERRYITTWLINIAIRLGRFTVKKKFKKKIKKKNKPNTRFGWIGLGYTKFIDLELCWDNLRLNCLTFTKCERLLIRVGRRRHLFIYVDKNVFNIFGDFNDDAKTNPIFASYF